MASADCIMPHKKTEKQRKNRGEKKTIANA